MRSLLLPLTFAVSTLLAHPMAHALDITAVSVWGGQPMSTVDAPQMITHLTVHHQGESWTPGKDVPTYLRNLQKWSRETKHWADIPYHYVIAPDGKVYAARPETQAGDTNTEYDPRGHLLVMLLGNFEDVEPTPEALNSLAELLTIKARQYGLDASAIASHKDWSKQTVCPGKNLYRYLENGWLRGEVTRRLAAMPSRPVRAQIHPEPDITRPVEPKGPTR
ncbi:peptidoglycan recognition family protein [Burkholderiaceae bacterium UC74_6]